ncbi:hypothetical protein C8R44DRAFT_803343 [Mycena epipterygia]|nr:hypothetical protein C8R44DRAFT_803343 [Mycena epipterygia]
MPDLSSSSVGKHTARSGAIYNSADLVCALIEEETAAAIKPYQDALNALQQQLKVADDQNIRLVQNTASVFAQSMEQSTKDLDELRAILEENGIGVVSTSGHQVLCFVGDRARLIGQIDKQVKLLVPDPASYQPITPSSIVKTLLDCLTDCARRLDEAHAAFRQGVKQRDKLTLALTQRNDEVEAETGRWNIQRTQLEDACKEEKERATALLDELTPLREEAQTLTLRVLSARTESNEWKAKYHALETERDSLKSAVDTHDGKLAAVQADLDGSKAKCLAAEGDLKAANDESDGKLLTMQRELDEWKGKCLAAEAELKTVADEREAKLTAAQADMDTWKARSLTADNERDSAQSALRAAYAKLVEHLDNTKTQLAQWTAKAAAWEVERTRHKNQTARNAALISQLQSTDLPRLKTQLHDVEKERDQLRASLQTENAQALARNNALVAELEELKKKYSAATTSPRPSSSMFIKARTTPLRTTSIPDKPPSQGAPAETSPRVLASAPVTPMSRRSFSHPTPSPSLSKTPSEHLEQPPVVALQAGVSLRRAVSGAAGPFTTAVGTRFSTAEGSKGKPTVLRKPSAPQPRAPPVFTPNATWSSEVLSKAQPLTRATPRSTPAERLPAAFPSSSPSQPNPHLSMASSTASKRSPEDSLSPTISKRPALSLQSNAGSTPKPVTDVSLKRSAPSPLLSELPKVPRTAETFSPSSRSSFTKPPTVITPPGQPQRVPTPVITPKTPVPSTSTTTLRSRKPPTSKAP